MTQWSRWGLLVAALSSTGCELILGIEERELVGANETNSSGPPFKHVWSKGLGGSAEVEGVDVAVDSDGNVLVAGMFTGLADFDGHPSFSSNGSSAFFVLKLDPSGNVLWSRSFPGIAPAHYSYTISVTPDASDNVLITGSFNSQVFIFGEELSNNAGSGDAFVVKLNKNGDLVWRKQIYSDGTNGTSARPSDLTADSQGNVYITLSSGAAELGVEGDSNPVVCAYFDPGQSSFTLKFNASGDFIWGHCAPGTATGLAVTSTGDTVVVTGSFSGTTDFGGGQVAAGASYFGLFALWLDGAGGTYLRSKTFGNTSWGGPRVAMGSQGDVLLAGEFDGTIASDWAGDTLLTGDDSAAFMLKLNSPGDRVFSVSRDAESSSGVGLPGLALDPSGNAFAVFTSGWYSRNELLLWSVPSQGGDGVAQRFMVAGQRSSIAYGSGAVILTGSFFDGDTDFGGGSLTNEGEGEGVSNAFVAKLLPP